MRTRTRPLASIAVVVAALMILLATGCGDDGSASDDVPTTSADSTTSTTPMPPDLPGRLMFSRFNEATHTFVSEHVSAPDGSDERALRLPGPEGGGRWSHDGEHIAVMTLLDDERVGTAIITGDGTVERVLGIPDPTLNLVCTVWSPDDTHLACEGWDDGDESRGGLYQVSAADGGELVRLTPTSMGQIQPGDYTPDGTALLVKDAGFEERGPLMLLPLDGGDPLALADDAYENPGRFSPDGTLIATSDGRRIVVLDLDGEERDEITIEGHNLFGPAWSPDGEWLAFSGGSGGPFADIFVATPDGSEVHRVTDTPENEINVDWGSTG